MSVTAALEHLWVAASLNLKVRFLSLLFLKLVFHSLHFPN